MDETENGKKVVPFTMVFDTAIRELGLVDGYTLSLIFRHCLMTDEIFRAGIENKASALGIGKNQLRRAIHRLAKAGLISDQTPEIKHRPHHYLLTEKGVNLITQDDRFELPKELNSIASTSLENLARSPKIGDLKQETQNRRPILGDEETIERKPDSRNQILHAPDSASNMSFSEEETPNGFFASSQFRETVKEIRNSGWSLSPKMEQTIATFACVTGLPLPTNGDRQKWGKGASDHLQAFELADLPRLYAAAWERAHKKGMTGLTWPGVLTNSMLAEQHRQKLLTQGVSER